MEVIGIIDIGEITVVGDNTVSTNKLGDNSVTTAKILDDAVTIVAKQTSRDTTGELMLRCHGAAGAPTELSAAGTSSESNF